MSRLKMMISAVGAAMVVLVGLAGPAGAGGKAGMDPGRRNSTGGLARAEANLANVDLQNNGKPLEQVTLNLANSQDPTQPGVAPGGGGCPTC
jgi:hypothetical protein